MIGLCLLPGLGGPLLRQAEAAGDLARALADLSESDELEPADSGLGDEPSMGLARSEATLAAPCDDDSASADELSTALPVHDARPTPHHFGSRPRSTPCHAEPAPRRLARLQVLRF
jgi:hypothetical protein